MKFVKGPEEQRQSLARAAEGGSQQPDQGTERARLNQLAYSAIHNGRNTYDLSDTTESSPPSTEPLHEWPQTSTEPTTEEPETLRQGRRPAQRLS
jgi:hypothetical protein